MNKQLGCFLPPVAIVIFLAFFVGSSAKLNCNKLEENHTQCQLQKFRMFGLISTSVENFRLTKTDAKILIARDSEGSSTYYKLLLYEQNKSFEFYEHGKLNFFDNDAELDKKRIDTFLVEANEKATLEIDYKLDVRGAKYIVEVLIYTLIIILIFFIFIILCGIFSAIGSVFRRY
ncbi:MAG: hypothetical protein VKN72_16615 [Nostocales cyanobacterium 94392]|nr:hypothetical protein [Nostocales cyanobacterium 94392]